MDTDSDGDVDRALNFSFGGTDGTVIGHELEIPAVESRFAVQQELDSAPVFDDCEMGVVIYVPWLNNMARRTTLIITPAIM